MSGMSRYPCAAPNDLLPHAPPMCLIELVVAVDERRIHCRSASHRDPCHPLRGRDGLGVEHAIEYAAQAAALHGALGRAGGAAAAEPRVLIVLRDVRFGTDWLHTHAAPLDVEAELLAADQRTVRYATRVTAGDTLLCSAELTLTTLASG